MDSAYKSDDVTNQMLLKKAKEYCPDYIFPKGYPGNPEETIKSNKEFVRLARKEDGIFPEVVPIVQPDHADHLEEHRNFYGEFGKVALGGLQKFGSQEQVAVVKQVRGVDGFNERYIHGFGVGTSKPMINAIRNIPDFLDSIDISTAESAIQNGRIPGTTMEQYRTSIPCGEDVTTVRAQFTKGILIMINYLLSEKVSNKKTDGLYDGSELEELNKEVEEMDVTGRKDMSYNTEASSDSRTLKSFCD